MAETTADLGVDQFGAEILRSIASNPTRDHWLAYEAAKRQFAELHPDAAADQHEAFVQALARQLNV